MPKNARRLNEHKNLRYCRKKSAAWLDLRKKLTNKVYTFVWQERLLFYSFSKNNSVFVFFLDFSWFLIVERVPEIGKHFRRAFWFDHVEKSEKVLDRVLIHLEVEINNFCLAKKQTFRAACRSCSFASIEETKDPRFVFDIPWISSYFLTTRKPNIRPVVIKSSWSSAEK